MKRQLAVLLALILASGSGLATADRDRHEGGRHGGHHGKHHGKHHWKHPGYRSGGHWYSDRSHWHYHPRPYYRPRVYYSYDPYLPLGAALVGTAIGYTLSQAGSDCNGGCTTTTVTRSVNSNVSSCFRIERYADGSERRVELPISQCY